MNLFDHIATCLRLNKIPNGDNVFEVFENCSEWPPVTRSYLERRGTMKGNIEAALRPLFDNEVAGDGEFKRVMEEELSQLKRCRNDHEFGFVALACGLSEPHHFY